MSTARAPIPKRALSRRSAIRHACRTSGVPHYGQDLRTTRGRCQHGRCQGRWAVTRVSLDFRFEWADRVATLECASCGRTWRRVKVPPLRSPAGYQAVLLTLILRGNHKRWHSRGRWHVQGDDAVVVRDADLGDVDEAARAHARRMGRLQDLRAARKARKDAEAAAEAERTREWLARMDERDREREAEERAAAERERLGLA